MKILTVHDDCAAPGGSNQFRKELAVRLRDLGIEVFLFTQGDIDGEEAAPYQRYRHSRAIPVLRHFERHYFNPALVRALRRYVRSVRPDLIHLHHTYLFPASLLLACWDEAPVVQTVHDFRVLCLLEGPGEALETPYGPLCQRCLGGICIREDHWPWTRPVFSLFRERLPKTYLRRVMKASVSAFIAPSVSLEKALGGLGLPTFFLPHFVDCSRYSASAPPAGGRNILFAGYLHFGKGVQVLLEAFAKVASRVPSATLQIAGTGPYEQELKRRSAALEIEERVSFLGWTSAAAVQELLNRSAIVALPSVSYENSPVIIYEAMAASRAVVASRIGGIPDLVSDGITGFLTAPGDVAELSERLLELLLDGEKAREMGRKGREIAQSRYRPENHVERYLSLAHRLASGGRIRGEDGPDLKASAQRLH